MKKKYYLSLFLALQVIFILVIKKFPELVETYYSKTLFLNISHFFRIILGQIPFSVGDIIYLFLILFILFTVLKTRKKCTQKWRQYLLNTVNFLSIIYFLFHFLWGYNYYRQPLFEKMKLQKQYTTEDLYGFTEKLILKTNQIQFEITKNKNLKVASPLHHADLLDITKIGYDNLAKQYLFFEYQIPSIKQSLFSLPLSYMGFSGYLNPFTNEAHYNVYSPKYNLPMTICHEMAHQIGYASESECNFIGYLTANSNNNLYFKYAANTMALKYCLRAVQLQNAEKAFFYRSKLNNGIIKNFEEDKKYYQKYHTFIETGFEIFYDNFLKLNQQKDGIEGYSKYLDLLINFNKQHPYSI